ncbi:PREDICTED: annexin D4-like isoform X1 [Nelumbo nucifera]|uniref:Annexin D4-like isoform X1 n=1 Tax=Nelumbo nucifera TaxID=4432 RepID=A0A1U7Z1V0_NELNU|nr:PREDICTED: annexin D4-like isoform X1 [Nelumbo nucifera]
MALPGDLDALTKAFSGFGVDENSIISILGKWHPEQRKSFRKGFPQFFREDKRLFERWDERHIAFLEHEFLRFKNAMVLWTLHPWERDARLAKEALAKGDYDILVEIACTRSSEELLGARRAYHSLFDHSIEEDVAYSVNDSNRNLLVALVSSYRYEGARVNEEIAETEAKTLSEAIKNAEKRPIENEEVVRIITTRSKLHLKAVFNYYKEISGTTTEEDLEEGSSLSYTIQCISSPKTYFSKILASALKGSADEKNKQALTRVIVTQADSYMKEISEEYHKQHGVSLSQKIEETTNGNYKDFLLTLVARGD